MSFMPTAKDLTFGRHCHADCQPLQEYVRSTYCVPGRASTSGSQRHPGCPAAWRGHRQRRASPLPPVPGDTARPRTPSQNLHRWPPEDRTLCSLGPPQTLNRPPEMLCAPQISTGRAGGPLPTWPGSEPNPLRSAQGGRGAKRALQMRGLSLGAERPAQGDRCDSWDQNQNQARLVPQ